MKKRNPFLFIAFAYMAVLLLVPGAAAATDLDEGTYSIDYTVLQVANDSVSIANDYFLKPAILTVDKGKQLIEITISHSEWVKSLKAAEGESFVDVDVVNEDNANDTRTVTFEVGTDLSQPINMQMHIHIASMVPVYDHKYTVRYDFDVTSIEAINPPPVKSSELEPEEIPSKSNTALIYFLMGLLVVTSIFLARKFIFSKKH
jgi:heme-binding NEAT domain protein